MGNVGKVKVKNVFLADSAGYAAKLLNISIPRSAHRRVGRFETWLYWMGRQFSLEFEPERFSGGVNNSAVDRNRRRISLTARHLTALLSSGRSRPPGGEL